MPPDSSSFEAGSLGQPRKRRAKRSLATLLRERGVLSTQHAVEVVLDICEALAPAHENGIVHGQLGLGCVRLAFTPTDGPRNVEIFSLTSGADESGAVQAAAFVEPDRMRGGAAMIADVRSDIWALGALLFAMVVGRAPSSAAPVTVPEESAPRSLASVIEACLSLDREQRPSSIDDLAEKIASFATWPPDQFARLAKRRDARAAAERVRLHRERYGLGNVPSVLDKLDDAALARAQRNDTAASLTSVLHTKTSAAALERLMTAVHEGTDAARIELAAALPALVDFDDEDEVMLPTVVETEAPSLLEPVACPLAIPPPASPLAELPALAIARAAAAAPDAPRPLRRFLVTTAAATAIVLGAGLVGYVLSATASATAEPAPQTPTAPPTATATATAPPIPVFSPSALPEAPAVTPASLPEAKR